MNGDYPRFRKLLCHSYMLAYGLMIAFMEGPRLFRPHIEHSPLRYAHSTSSAKLRQTKRKIDIAM